MSLPLISGQNNIDLEKWVSQEMKEVEEDTDEGKDRPQTLKIICEQPIPWTDNKNIEGGFISQPSVTDRISDLKSGTKSIESNNSSCKFTNQLNKNTIDELLRTDSDKSPDNIGLEQYLKESAQKEIDEKSISELSSEYFAKVAVPKTDENENLQNTLDLINEDFSKYLDNKEDNLKESCGELDEDPKNTYVDNAMMLKEKNTEKDEEEDKISSQEDNSEDKIISTEVNLNEDIEENEETSSVDETTAENNKIAISENILSTLVREIEECMFPMRPDPHKESHDNLNSKYSEKAVFHIKPIPEQMEELETGKENKNIIEDSEPSLDGVGEEIMMNFNLIRNFEMKRTRIEKNHYDSEIFSNYIKEVFDAIQSRSDLFLKAFSKPIQKDYLESLTKLHYHGIEEPPVENFEDSMVDNLDDQASILTIDLYLSLEKKREEENELISKLNLFNFMLKFTFIGNFATKEENNLEITAKESKLDQSEESSFEIPPTKMPIGLIKGNK